MKLLKVDLIDASSLTQTRVKLDQSVVDEYADLMSVGIEFPDIVVFAGDQSEAIILADGFHRLAAAKKAGKETINCDIRDGDLHDALTHALSSNDDHGLRRNNADKRKAIEICLNNPKFEDWSARRLSLLCNVAHTTVNRIVDEHEREASEDGSNNPSPRPRKEPPSQEQVDRKQLLSALDAVRAFPYDGIEAFSRLKLDDKVDDINYVCDWLAEVLAGKIAKARNE